MEIKFNVNNYVKVKLTDFGKYIYYHKNDAINAQYGKEILKPSYPKLDKDGYLKEQLWYIMQIFGPYVQMGMDPPFETNIVLINN